jgi:thiamine pyrophosphate-dependent acetolactate synthase large subunit-like protein
VHLAGDGGALQNIQELDTVARLGVKVLFIILNDEAYGAEYHKLKSKGLNGNLSVVRSPDFGAVGRAFGCRGRLASNLDDVAAGIDEFLAGDGPMVLDVRILRNVISIPYRRMCYGQDS